MMSVMPARAASPYAPLSKRTNCTAAPTRRAEVAERRGRCPLS
jgi:hypothetical protein